MNADRMRQLRPEGTNRDAFMPTIDMGDVLRGLFDKLRRRWTILAGFLTTFIALAVIYVLTSTPLYTATGSILIDPRVGQSPEGAAQMMPGLLMSDALTVDSELRVLTSREVTSSAVRELGITPPEDPEPSLTQRLNAFLGLDTSDEEPLFTLSEEEQAELRMESLRTGFMRDMRVQRAGDTFVIDVAYTSPDRGFAPQAVNTLIREYLRLSGAQQTAMIERNQLWLADRIDELRVEVEDSETAIAEFRRINELLAPEGQLLPIEVALNAAVEELVRLRGAAVAVDVQVEQLTEQIEGGDIEAVQIPLEERSQALNDFETRFAELEQEEQELLLSWAETAPVVINVRQQKAQTQDLIIDELRQIRDRLRASGEGLQRQVAAIEVIIDELRTEYGADIRKTVELRSLEREAEAKRELYERLLQEFNSASQLLTFDGTSARVIAWAVTPDRKSAPQSRQIVVLAAFAALVLAVSTIFLIEALDTGFRKQGEIGQDLGLPFLGVVPSFGSEKEGAGLLGGLLPGAPARRRGRWRKLSKAARWLDFAAISPTSHTADTMRMIHAQLSMKRHDLSQEEGGVVVGFTSSTHDEGKTTTAANFASFLARRHERVVLVDMDLIRLELSRLMAPVLPETNNLSAFIEDPQDAISRMEPIPEFPGLAVIGNLDGRLPRSATPRNAELLQEALSSLRQHFDYIVVDLPPAQGTADTQLLATLCDCLIYAIRWGRTPREQVIASLRQRGLDRKRIFGALYTQAPLGRYRTYNRHEVNEYYA